MAIRAVIFDMDGVLIDAKDLHYEALNRALSLFGHTISRYDHLVTYDGLPTKNKLEMLTRERGLPTDLHPLLNALKQQYLTAMVHAHCKPVYHHEYALSRLKQQGLRLAVASNSIRSSVELMMEKSNLRKYLDVILSNQDVQKAKPDPEIYLKAFELLQIAPCEAMIVEDNERGIQAARASGAHTMIVDTVDDVTIDNIHRHLCKFESRQW